MIVIWTGALPRVVIGSMKAQVENISFEKATSTITCVSDSTS